MRLAEKDEKAKVCDTLTCNNKGRCDATVFLLREMQGKELNIERALDLCRDTTTAIFTQLCGVADGETLGVLRGLDHMRLLWKKLVTDVHRVDKFLHGQES
jgi:hypothetical protein